jgi:Dolichyl-phosphate-mannose-protein mannosyltransferase
MHARAVPNSSWTISKHAVVALAVALLITLYGGLLRLDAYVTKYGTLDHPTWARVLTRDVAPVASRLRPSSFSWRPETRPYEGGDPTNYLRFAREMRSFYQAHVREPVFLAMTRGALWMLDGQDAGVSFASMLGSVLVVLATFLLGSAVFSRTVGLVAALLIAIEYEAITWAPDGWRDDAATATVVLAAWGFVRLHRSPSLRYAILAGGLSAISCLTRLSALSLVLPAFVWLVLDGEASGRQRRARHGALAFVVFAALLAPFLVNCYLATGDPLFALNYHTVYYRHAEGRPIADAMSAGEYVRTKLAERPIGTLDTALIGLFWQPFVTKWNGFAHWIAGLGSFLQWLAIVGIAAWGFFPVGRLLLVILFGSLVPYMLTWNIADGGAWRFTMHAYPFFLIAAASVPIAVWQLARRLPQIPSAERRAALRTVLLRASVALAVAATGAALYYGLPWFVSREAIAKGEATSLDTGPRDAVFYRGGWFAPRPDGVMVRVSRGRRSLVRLPLPQTRAYDIVLRLDPVMVSAPSTFHVLFNGHMVGMFHLASDSQRVGSYRFRVHEHMIGRRNELTIVPESLVAAGSAGERFAWIDPAEQIAVRLWYVRVLPVP